VAGAQRNYQETGPGSDDMNEDQDRKGAGVKFPPPLIFLSAILLGYAMHYVSPLLIGDAIGLIIAGAVQVITAVIVIFIVAVTFRRIKTHIEPWKPTSSIVSTGIFAVSRNPVYLAFCWINIGIGLILNSWWVLLSFVPAAILVYLIAIKPEEDYLERKFGDEYLRYKLRVRRWL
jgi:protein-S-isoprenylcysteine O-methyltransferase Ste14